jgi:hypothetical protein
VAVSLILAILIVAFLIFGLPGYMEPNPAIALKVAIGIVLGLVFLAFKAMTNGRAKK